MDQDKQNLGSILRQMTDEINNARAKDALEVAEKFLSESAGEWIVEMEKAAKNGQHRIPLCDGWRWQGFDEYEQTAISRLAEEWANERGLKLKKFGYLLHLSW